MKILLALLFMISTTTFSQIKLPPPAGGMTVEIVSQDTAQVQLVREIHNLAARLKEINPPVSTVLYCLASSMYLHEEETLSEICTNAIKALMKTRQKQE